MDHPRSCDARGGVATIRWFAVVVSVRRLPRPASGTLCRTICHSLRCRRCLGLAYHSQRLAPFDRLTQRAENLARRLGESDPGVIFSTGLLPAKTKGMHWRTFERKRAQLEATLARRDAVWMVRAARIVGWR